MTLYSIFIITSFILFYLDTIGTMRNPNLKTDARLNTIFPTGAGLIFVLSVNNTSDDDYLVELLGDNCCLAIGQETDCDLLEVTGACIDRIPSGTSKTMKLVAPILDPFERIGQCSFHLDSKSSRRRKKTMRNRLKMHFDTRIGNTDQPMVLPKNVRHCDEIDEDPFNDCQFVDCDTYYNGKKPYFDRKIRKCSEVPVCISDEEAGLVYDSTTNVCQEIGVKKEDLDFVRQLTDGKPRTTKDIIIIKNAKNQHTYKIPHKKVSKVSTTKKYTYSNRYLQYLTEISTSEGTTALPIGKLLNGNDNLYLNHKESLHTWLKDQSLEFHWFHSLFQKCSVHILAIVILIQCCCICAMICFFPRPCNCGNQKKIVKSFLNYRQDVSVTTPLIDTSNIDTETTNYTSESNIDKKIKCYKACQKDVNMKTSLSDDILSKCITRRDWHSKHSKYPPEKYKTKSDICKIQEKSELEEESNVIEVKPQEAPKDCKVQIEKATESREREKKSAIRKSILRKLETKSDSEETVPQFDSSEKEIQSHIYTEQASDLACVQSEGAKYRKTYKPKTVLENAFSVSTEKGAQVEFSNDSIDDFLSERGMIFIAGDNMSKLSFPSSSEVKKTSISGSSKTSKNNIVKNMFSIFRRHSKVGPSSDPGAKKSGINVELRHVSHASLYSSSNDSSEYIRCLKKMNDSRTSL